ncbi:Re/Si-specific NAD(P)(+) transhydrogenase subunit alpha [Methylophilaceae bacterium]|jgi:NAD(P) transhydrogenase subunit alpha|nr:Re/Si-specific NAD(P)(+) transhydrogenase subunit alpha [Methylophilaceae bacterium]|tara:strand:+ start:2465 stop:3589 length:1125 start_codon:yes stop_codon:yes gene_type:complete
MIIGVLKETVEGEFRVAATPETVKKLISLKHTVYLESDAGIEASITNQMYIDAGGIIKKNADIFKSDLILKVRAPNNGEVDKLQANQFIVGLLEPFNTKLTSQLSSKKVTAFSLEALPRNTRAQSMDVLSSQANIAGYKAVILAADYFKKFFPMLMTAAGTVKAARIIVLGAGVAGLQAIATAKRLGAVVEASDVRPAVKEQIESLGAKFIDVPYETEEEVNNASGEGGYAKPMPKSWLDRQTKMVSERAIAADIIITSALIPGKEPPKLISKETIHQMKEGSVIVDMAAGLAEDGSGNCPLSQDNKVINIGGVTIIGLNNLPSLVSTDASALYSRNIFEFIKLLFDDQGKLYINRDDELVSGTLLTNEGNLIN